MFQLKRQHRCLAILPVQYKSTQNAFACFQASFVRQVGDPRLNESVLGSLPKYAHKRVQDRAIWLRFITELLNRPWYVPIESPYAAQTVAHSVFVLAKTSVRSPRKLCIFIIQTSVMPRQGRLA